MESIKSVFFWIGRYGMLLESVVLVLGFVALLQIDARWLSGFCLGLSIVSLLLWVDQMRDDSLHELNEHGRHYFNGKFVRIVEDD